MNKVRSVMLHACLAIWLAVPFGSPAIAAPRDGPTTDPIAIVFFDVLDLPARIDEPRLSKRDKDFVWTARSRNVGSGEQLLGIRLVLLVIDPAGKLRSRIIWSERVDLAMYSIKTFAFHPPITGEMMKNLINCFSD